MAFTSIAALASGAAATTTLVLGAIAEVGLAMTVVGGVTGNKSLMKVGAVLGLVGGIGGMINSAASGTASGASMAATGADVASVGEAGWGMGLDSATTGSGALEAMAGDSLASSASGFLGEGASSGITSWDALVTDAQQTAFGAIDQAAGATTQATQTDALIGVNEPMSATKDVYGNLNATQATEPARQSLAPTTQDMIGEEVTGKFDMNGSDVMDEAFNGTGAGGFGGGAVDQKSWFSKIMDWAKKNEKLATSAMTLMSGGLSGMGQMKQAEMAQEANRMRYGYGNQVANFRGRQPLIGVA
jgi:hypothetical protein